MIATRSISTLARENAKTRSAAALVAGVDKLKAALAQGRDRGASGEFLMKLEQDGKAALKYDLARNQKAEQARIEAEMEKERGRWAKEYQRDLPRHSFETAAVERRYRSFSDRELTNLAVDYSGNPATITDEYAVDALAAELRTRQLTVEHAAVRQAAAAVGYDRPWLRDGRGAELKLEHELNKPVSGGGYLARIGDAITAFSVADVWEE